MKEEDRRALEADSDYVTFVKELPDGDVIGLYRYAFTTALVVLTGNYAEAVRHYWDGQKRRFCYADGMEAFAAGIQWDGSGDPPGRWIKDKSPGQDRLNPAFGTALFDEV